jgi:hypothetical protein
MLSWDDAQSRFAGALLAADSPPSAGVVDAGHGFAVYRNNIVSSLLDALQDRYPVTCALVGTEFFRAMARLFAQEHLPESPLMMFYGDALPDFIAAFEPARSVPYLAGVAQLEAAWTYAYHSADAAALDASSLGDIDAAALATSTLRLHPSLRLIRSAYPVASIWAAHQGDDAPRIDLHRAEDVLIIRPGSDVILHRLSRGAFAFVHALCGGDSVEHAARAAAMEAPDFDAGAHLLSLFSMEAITAIEPATEERS